MSVKPNCDVSNTQVWMIDWEGAATCIGALRWQPENVEADILVRLDVS